MIGSLYFCLSSLEKLSNIEDVCCNGIFVKKHVGTVLKNNRKRPGALYLKTPLLLPSIWVHLCRNQAHLAPGVFFYFASFLTISVTTGSSC